MYAIPSRISLLVAGLALLGSACQSDTPLPAEADTVTATPRFINPADAFGQFFIDVQLSDLFEDSKTFVDMAPKRSAAEILADYERFKEQADFDLAQFVADNFSDAKMYAKDFQSDPSFNLDKHIERLWPILTRDEDQQQQVGSLIPLPHDYVVPGGRFREVYYWDSYFTMLGLLVDGQFDYAQRMVDNFAYLIDTVGFIPNGNRSYYLSRSQPPFFAPMVGLLDDATEEDLVAKYLPQLEAEYNFWMRGADELSKAGEAKLRTARTAGDFLVNRYFDERPRPRPEGYKEDSLLVAESTRSGAELYTDLRAAAESGWDFSSRWFSDPADIGTIRTTRIAPVDLNSLLYYLESMLSGAYAKAGDSAKEQQYAQRAYERRRAVISAFWDAELKWFVDYDLDTERTTGEATLAGMFPLFFELATEEQAAEAAKRLEADFLKPGGVVTSLRNTGQQWDAPNGWPPLQWVTIKGLRNYGFDKLAREVAERWLKSGRTVYARTGKVVEKYNVVDTSLIAGGGEYPNQDGFGWSNGVFARIIEDYPGI